MIELNRATGRRLSITVIVDPFVRVTIDWKFRWFKTPRELPEGGVYDHETSVMLSNGVRATARCSLSDNFSRGYGQFLALERALDPFTATEQGVTSFTKDERKLIWGEIWKVFPTPHHPTARSVEGE